MNMSINEMMPHFRAFAKSMKCASTSIRPVPYLPDLSAIVNACYQNVDDKVVRDGGGAQYGWYFRLMYATTISDIGYLTATHHAVWRSPKSQLIDVTPLNPNQSLHPLNLNGKIYFLIDDKAEPARIEGYPLPLPMKFYALNNGKKLMAYLEELTKKEEAACAEYNQKLKEEITALRESRL